MTTTLGVALIRLLEQYQVEHVFGIPGVHTIELYRGLGDSSITHHTPRHEQGAGFMADGYARSSGKPGVCLVITGPGLTNISTAMGQALADSIPMLVISAVNHPGSTPHTSGQLHEMPNQSGYASNVARFSETITSIDDLAGAMARAFSLFASARPGPVHLEIPVPLLSEPCELPPLNATLRSPPAADAGAIHSAAQLLNASTKPIILAGGGARNAGDAIRRLAEKIDAPVAMTINARSVLPTDHPLALPVSGSLNAMRQLIEQSDTVLAIGTELAPTDYDMYRNFGFDIPGKLIRCDIDYRALQTNFFCDIALLGDAKASVEQLIAAVEPGQHQANTAVKHTLDAAFNELDGSMQKHIVLLQAIRDQFPAAAFVGDSTQLVYSGNLYFGTHAEGHWFNSSTGFGTLGYALPASIGAAIAKPASPVICLIGDGGLQFVLGELGTLADSGRPLIVLVWANQGYREIKNAMQGVDVTPVGVDLSVPDFCQIAHAYDLQSSRIHSPVELLKAIEATQRDTSAVLIEIDETEMMEQLSVEST
jgi:acetolactate synthase-1/2/3 large subunit